MKPKLARKLPSVLQVEEVGDLLEHADCMDLLRNRGSIGIGKHHLQQQLASHCSSIQNGLKVNPSEVSSGIQTVPGLVSR